MTKNFPKIDEDFTCSMRHKESLQVLRKMNEISENPKTLKSMKLPDLNLKVNFYSSVALWAVGEF